MEVIRRELLSQHRSGPIYKNSIVKVMAIDTNLVQSGLPADEKLDKLIAFLSSHVPLNGFFENNSFEIQHLRTALHKARAEIYGKLDIELEALIDIANEPEYSVEADKRKMYEARVTDWENLMSTEIDSFGEEKTIEYLKDARTEIAWLKREASRLEVHVQNAREVKEHKDGHRKSFSYHPTERRDE